MLELSEYLAGVGISHTVRCHPASVKKYKKLLDRLGVDLDDNKSTLNSCKVVASINSSYAMEVVMNDRCKSLCFDTKVSHLPRLEKEVLLLHNCQITGKHTMVADWLKK